MLSIFDQPGLRPLRAALRLDEFISFARQWLLRSSAWKVLLATAGGLLQVFGFGWPMAAHQAHARSHQELTPSAEQIMLLALTLVLGLLLMIIGMSFWNAHFQRLRAGSYPGRQKQQPR